MSDPVDAVEGIVHEPTQVHEDGGIDLTVTGIREVQRPRRVGWLARRRQWWSTD
jgi:hypothetical protein